MHTENKLTEDYAIYTRYVLYFISNLRVNITGSKLQICQGISPSWRLQMCMAVVQKCLQYQIKYTDMNQPFSRRYIAFLWRLTENANKIILETLELLNTTHGKTSHHHHNPLEMETLNMIHGTIFYLGKSFNDRKVYLHIK